MQNVQGLSIEKFNNLLHNVFTMDYDLICLQETWLKSLDITNFEVPDYICINKPRSFKSKRAKRGYGGILLYVHTRIQQYTELQSNTNTEDRVWIKFKEPSLADVDVFCCFCYIPPINSVVMCNKASQWTTFELEVLNFSAKGKIRYECSDGDSIGLYTPQYKHSHRHTMQLHH